MNSESKNKARRMKHGRVFVVNTAQNTTLSLCGLIHIGDEWTVEKQTYRLMKQSNCS